MSTPGFYGKLASRGDFVSRGLPQSFIGPWDSWLAAGLLASQSLGDRWLDAYLVSPLWRFMLGPGVCGPQAAVGVVMPSIDRVGRYFPLTVAVLLDHDADPASVVGGSDAWFEQVEQLMLSTLSVEASFEAFGAGLEMLGSPAYLPRAPSSRFAGLNRFDATDPQARMTALAEQACEGASVWWGQGSERIAPGLLRCQGLPAAADFAQFLLGQEGVV
ncbi:MULTISPECIES: type VI secretion system-associated protein TagF [Pseudomonas]|uniref:Type VI secretion system-associated protein TagF n=1 Tax=Pseudomonas cucumis TaxID=2954082 RepID=A0ABY9EY05_9PSED|nr:MULTISPECIES: type VI secretion system-associated protein TagF [Pseudomonas]MDR8367770.1 type VI secretion system-associated protein TagF [Pseudomonas sp. JL3]URM29085.1 type VI secretion system-associated protein TagF [Pseudomonas frederiksbergensis]WLG84816.1 type VI secretion system-associated protein TagF [Pseudomonas cucumis]WLG90372.1 type VI secretion system-associated protein TagF [Pseudomonas cucumis]